MQDLLTQALGIDSPWLIKDVEFNNKQRFCNAIYFHVGGLQLYPSEISAQ